MPEEGEFLIGQRVAVTNGQQGTVCGIDGDHIYIRLQASQRVVKVLASEVSNGWREPKDP